MESSINHQITMGSDPEFIVVNSKTKECVPAFSKVAGTKLDPQSLNLVGYSMLYDNTLIEGNIPPARDKEQFVTNMILLKDLLNGFLGKYDLEIMSNDIGEYNRLDLTDERALEFGCSPFLNAWTWEEQTAPVITEKFRPAGFHIHIGYKNPTIYPNDLLNNAIARAYDLFVILPSLKVHSDPRRWNNYGGYGKFREKPYGLEVRSLGGYFTKDEYLPWVYDQTVAAFNYACENAEILLSMNEDDITAEFVENTLLIEFESLVPVIDKELIKV